MPDERPFRRGCGSATNLTVSAVPNGPTRQARLDFEFVAKQMRLHFALGEAIDK